MNSRDSRGAAPNPGRRYNLLHLVFSPGLKAAPSSPGESLSQQFTEDQMTEPKTTRLDTLTHPLILLLFAATLTALVYQRVLGLPLFMDDVVFLWITGSSTVGEMFLQPLSLESYYRPVSLMPTRLLLVAGGGEINPAWLHALPFTVHLLSGWLAALITRRAFPEKRTLPLVVLALYLLFPFTYEMVHWHAAIQQGMAAFGVLLALFFTDRWWAEDTRYDLLLALLGVFIATFSHEVAIITVPLMLCWIMIMHLGFDLDAWKAVVKRLAILIGPAMLITIMYLVLRSRAPRLDQTAAINLNGFIDKLAYLAQGISYPAAWFGGPLGRVSGWPDLTAAIVTVIAGLVVLLAILWWGRDRRSLVALVWFAGGIAAPLLFLDPAYTLSGPRLLTTASFGAALAWGLALAILWEKSPGYLKAIPALLLAGILARSYWFIDTRLALHDQIAPPYEHIYANVDQRQVVINPPAWIAYRDKVFALGSEGVIYKGEFFPFSELVRINTNDTPDVYVAAFPGVMPELDHYYAPPVDENVPTFEQLTDQIAGADVAWTLTRVGDRFDLAYLTPGEPTTTVYRFTNGVELSGIVTGTRGNPTATASLMWRVTEPTSEVAFIHLLCDGELIGQADGPPLGGLYPFDAWSPGEAWREFRPIAIPVDIDPSCLQLAAGLYDPISGERVPLETGGDSVALSVFIQ